MKRSFLLSILLSIATTVWIKGQTDTRDISARLNSLFSRLSVREPDDLKLKMNDSIMSIIESYILSDTVFSHRFENIRNLGQIVSPDSVLKVISWNSIMNEGGSRYFCYFILKADTGRNKFIHKLSGTFTGKLIRSDTIYGEADWYGALIYDVRRIRSEDDDYWLALGINYGDRNITRKIIEVITFLPDNRITFGRKIFSDGDSLYYRVILEYSVEAVATLRFTSDSSVVFDHLVPFSPELSGDRRFYGPDYSYDAYTFENNRWKFVRNVDVRNKER